MTASTHEIKNNADGFSLVELVLVIAIMGSLLAIVSLNFRDYLVKHRVESQVRQMNTDFSALRVKAFTAKQRQSIVLDKSRYVFKSYSSEGEDKCTGGTITKTSTVSFNLKKDATNYYAGSCLDTFEIDTRGILLESTGTVFLETNSSSPVVDCIKIHTVRINPGKTNGSICDDK